MRISSVDSCGIMHIIQSVYSKQCTFPLNLCIKSHWNRLFDTYMYKCVYTFSAILLLKRFCFVFWLYSFMLLSFLVSLYFVFCIGFWLECLLGNSIIFNFDAVRMTLCVCIFLHFRLSILAAIALSFTRFATTRSGLYAQWLLGFQALRFLIFPSIVLSTYYLLFLTL